MPNPMLYETDLKRPPNVAISDNKVTFIKDFEGRFVWKEDEHEDYLSTNTLEGKLQSIKVLDQFTMQGGTYHTVEFKFVMNDFTLVYEAFFTQAATILNSLASIEDKKIGLVQIISYPKKDKNDPSKTYTGFIVAHNRTRLEWKYQFNELPQDKNEREAFWITVLESEILPKLPNEILS